MKIVYAWGSRKGQEIDIGDAIEASIEGHSEDQISNLREQVSQLAKAVGVLVEAMHNRGNITDDQVSQLLGYRFEVEKG